MTYSDRVYPWSSRLDRALVRARYRLCWRLAERLQFRRVCDLGCGYGIAYQDKPASINVVAVDLDLECIKYVHSTWPDIDVVQADIRLVPFRDKAFDMTLLMDVIEHLNPREGKLVLERIRVLTRKLIILSTPNRRAVRRNPHHVHEYTLRELRKLIEGTGLRILAVYGQARVSRCYMLLQRLGLGKVFSALQGVEETTSDYLEKSLSEEELVHLCSCEPYKPGVLHDYAHLIVVVRV